MDDELKALLAVICRHDLADYLSDDGRALIKEMERQRKEENYEHFLDLCEDYGMDREFAKSVTRTTI